MINSKIEDGECGDEAKIIAVLFCSRPGAGINPAFSVYGEKAEREHQAVIRHKSLFHYYLFLLGLLLFSCAGPQEPSTPSGPRPTPPPPAIPVSGKGIKIEDSKQYGNVRISWDAVPGAASYNIDVKGSTNSVTMKGFYTRLYHIVGLPKGAYITSVSALDAGGTVLERTEEVSYTVVTNNSYTPEDNFSGGDKTSTAVEPYGGWVSKSPVYVTINDELPLGIVGYNFRISDLNVSLSNFSSLLHGPVNKYPIRLENPFPDAIFMVHIFFKNFRGGDATNPPYNYMLFRAKKGFPAIKSAVQNLTAAVNKIPKTVTLKWDNNDPHVWLYIIEYKTPGGLTKRLSARAYDNGGKYLDRLFQRQRRHFNRVLTPFLFTG